MMIETRTDKCYATVRHYSLKASKRQPSLLFNLLEPFVVEHPSSSFFQRSFQFSTKVA